MHLAQACQMAILMYAGLSTLRLDNTVVPVSAARESKPSHPTRAEPTLLLDQLLLIITRC